MQILYLQVACNTVADSQTPFLSRLRWSAAWHSWLNIRFSGSLSSWKPWKQRLVTIMIRLRSFGKHYHSNQHGNCLRLKQTPHFFSSSWYKVTIFNTYCKVTKFRPVPIFVLLTWNWFVQTNFRTFEGLKTKPQKNVEIQGPQSKKKFSYSIKFSTFFESTKVRKLSTGWKFVTLQ